MLVGVKSCDCLDMYGKARKEGWMVNLLDGWRVENVNGVMVLCKIFNSELRKKGDGRKFY